MCNIAAQLISAAELTKERRTDFLAKGRLDEICLALVIKAELAGRNQN